jgi:tRNA threonylcarbamoyladenosine modification (KEOPS) complex  Pcc1 subunit
MKHKPKVSLLVAKDVALKGGGSAFATSSGVDLTNGQLGIYDASGAGANPINTSIDPVDAPDSPSVFLAQGTSFSGSPLSAVGPADQVANQTQAFKGSTVKSITFQPATTGVLSGWSIEDINADSNTEYSFSVAFRSRIKDRNYTQTALEVIQVNVPTGDLTALTSAEDFLVQNLVAQTNTFSKLVSTNGRVGNRDIVAFAVREAGSSGVSGAVAISAITAGTTAINGVVITAEMEAALDNIAVASTGITASSELVPINLATAGSNATGVDAIVVLGLNRDLAVGYDRIDQVKTRITVGLKNGFDSTVTLVEGSLAREAQGTPRVWRRFFEDTVGQRIYGKNKTLFPFAYQFPDYIDNAVTYDAIVVEYESEPYRRDHSLTVSNHKAIILVPSSGSNVAALKANLNSFFSLYCPQIAVPAF